MSKTSDELDKITKSIEAKELQLREDLGHDMRKQLWTEIFQLKERGILLCGILHFNKKWVDRDIKMEGYQLVLLKCMDMHCRFSNPISIGKAYKDYKPGEEYCEHCGSELATDEEIEMLNNIRYD